MQRNSVIYYINSRAIAIYSIEITDPGAVTQFLETKRYFS